MATLAPVAASDAQYLHLLEGIRFQPVFIIGSHRSGTTLLHQMLEATGTFNTVTPYLLIRRNTILSDYVLNQQEQGRKEVDDLFRGVGLTNRVFDKREVAADLAEEYAFVLKESFWRARINPNTLPKFIEFCKKVQVVSDSQRQLLLKNPWDSLNFMYIKRALPQSKFIFIHRNPLHTINSQMNALRSLLTTKNPYLDILITDRSYSRLFENPRLLGIFRFMFSPRSTLGLQLLTRYLGRVTTYFLQHVNSLPSSDVVSFRYEDLCVDPKPLIDQIMRMTGQHPQVEIDYTAQVAPRSLKLLPEVQRSRDQIYRRLNPYCTFFGYSE